MTVAARQAGPAVVLEVSDDGRGIDEAPLRARAIAHGLLASDSTASGRRAAPCAVRSGLLHPRRRHETSGRGVGLDVVRTAVEGAGRDRRGRDRARRRHALRAHPAGDTRCAALPARPLRRRAVRRAAARGRRDRGAGRRAGARRGRVPRPGTPGRDGAAQRLAEVLGAHGERDPRVAGAVPGRRADRGLGGRLPGGRARGRRQAARRVPRPLPRGGRGHDRQRRHACCSCLRDLRDARPAAAHAGAGVAGRRPPPYRPSNLSPRARTTAAARQPTSRAPPDAVLVVEDSIGRPRAAARDPRGRRVRRRDRGRRPGRASRLQQSRWTWSCPTSRCPAWTGSR